MYDLARQEQWPDEGAGSDGSSPSRPVSPGSEPPCEAPRSRDEPSRQDPPHERSPRKYRSLF